MLFLIFSKSLKILRNKVLENGTPIKPRLSSRTILRRKLFLLEADMIKRTKDPGKILCAAASLLILTFSFASCGNSRKAEKPVGLSEDFQKTAEITLDGKKYAANFKRGGADVWECEFTYPETIEGLKLTCSGEECRMDFQGLTYTTSRECIPEYGIMPLVTGSVDDVIAGRDVSCTSDGKTVTEKGIVNGEDFTAIVKNNELVSLEIAQKLTVKFK